MIAVLRRIFENSFNLRSLGVVWCGLCILAADTSALSEPPVMSIEAAPSLLLANQEDDVALHRASPEVRRHGSAVLDPSALAIARTAAARSGKASLLQGELRLQSDRRHRWIGQDRSPVESVWLTSAACRERQTAAAAALRLHFAIAATLASMELIDSTKGYLEQRGRAQSQLIEQGLPIEDPMLIERTRMQIEDESLVAQSRLHQLRIELSRWVGSEIACGYIATYTPMIHPSDSDVCEYVREAIYCRCELRALRMLKDELDARDLDDWDRVATSLLGMPSPVSNTAARRWTLVAHRVDTDAVRDRARWIQRLHQERAQHVTVEVETAFEKKRSAALRWVLSEAVIATWDQRVEQLERMNELRGNFPQQIQANLDRFRVRGEVIERWYEWHEAHIELGLATGTDW